MVESGLRGNVGEGSVVIVAIEVVGGSFAGRKAFERGAVDEKNVRPAVVVVVEDGHAGAGGFDDVFLGVHAAKGVRGRESGFGGDVYEVRDRFSVGLGILRGC